MTIESAPNALGAGRCISQVVGCVYYLQHEGRSGTKVEILVNQNDLTETLNSSFSFFFFVDVIIQDASHKDTPTNFMDTIKSNNASLLFNSLLLIYFTLSYFLFITVFISYGSVYYYISGMVLSRSMVPFTIVPYFGIT